MYKSFNSSPLPHVDDLFKKHNCDCVEVELTDFQDYIDVESSPVIPDAVKKVGISCIRFVL